MILSNENDLIKFEFEFSDEGQIQNIHIIHKGEYFPIIDFENKILMSIWINTANTFLINWLSKPPSVVPEIFHIESGAISEDVQTCRKCDGPLVDQKPCCGQSRDAKLLKCTKCNLVYRIVATSIKRKGPPDGPGF